MTNTQRNYDQQYQHQEQQKQSVATKLASSYGRARARDYITQQDELSSHAAFLHGQYLDCCEYYVANFRRSIMPVIQRTLAEYIRDGMSADVIRAAMDDTQLAPRPSWAYCAAILKRCYNDGILTLADWMAEKQRHNAAYNPALNYEQRKYTEDDFGPDFFFDPTQGGYHKE